MISDKITVKGIDVSTYIVDSFEFTSSANDNIPRGNFTLRADNPYSFKFGDDVGHYMTIDSEFKHYGGYITRVIPDTDNNRIRFETQGYKGLTYRTDFTGRFRQDSGNGNLKTIATSIIDEKHSDWTYTDTTIPDTDVEFLYKNFQDVKESIIFDEFAKRTNREFWVDKSKVAYLKNRTFTSVSSIITRNSNTGSVIIDNDLSRFGNIIRVRGATFPVSVIDQFTGTGVASEFTLTNFPSSSTQVSYTNGGTEISVVLEGAENYSDSSFYDAYFKPDTPSIKFNIATINGGTIDVRYQTYSQIKEELPDASSIDRYNMEQVKTVENPNITTQEDAYNIAVNELELSKDVVKVYTVPVIITSQQELEDWSVGNNAQYVDSSLTQNLNIVESTVRVTPDNRTHILRFNNSPKDKNVALANLLNKLNQRDNSKYSTGASLDKTFYWGGNIFITLDNIGLITQPKDTDAFHFGESLMGGTNIMADYSTTETVAISQNSLSTWVENFLDTFFIDESESTGTFTRGSPYLLQDGGTLQSKPFQYDGTNRTNATITVTADRTDLNLKLGNDSSSFTDATDSTALTFTTADEGTKYLINNNTGTDVYITKVEVSYE